MMLVGQQAKLYIISARQTGRCVCVCELSLSLPARGSKRSVRSRVFSELRSQNSLLQPLSSEKRRQLGLGAGAGRVGAEEAVTKLWLEAVTPEFDRLPSAGPQGSLSHSGCGFLRAEK